MKFALPVSCLLVALLVTAQASTGRKLAQAPAPGDCQTVYQVIEERGLTDFQAALDLDDLQPYLDSPDLGYTVFAPTNEAFQAAFNSLNTNLTDILYMGNLDALIQYHFLLQPYTGAELVQLGEVQTNNDNQTLSVMTMGSDVMVDSFASEARVTEADIQACQSIVHIIDSVLLPDFESEGAASS